MSSQHLSTEIKVLHLSLEEGRGNSHPTRITERRFFSYTFLPLFSDDEMEISPLWTFLNGTGPLVLTVVVTIRHNYGTRGLYHTTLPVKERHCKKGFWVLGVDQYSFRAPFRLPPQKCFVKSHHEEF